MSDSCSSCHYLVNDCICIEHRQCIAQLDEASRKAARMREALEKIKKHMEFIVGGYELSSIWNIAKSALSDEPEKGVGG